MAKRKKRRSVSRRRRRSASSPVSRRSRRRSSSGGGGYGLKPTKEDVKLVGMGALYGYLEAAARKDGAHVLNKLPRFVDVLGFSGNTALALWLASHFVRQPLVRIGARAVATIASYQMGSRGSLFGQAGEKFLISGPSDEDVANMIEAHIAGLDPYGVGEQVGYG